MKSSLKFGIPDRPSLTMRFLSFRNNTMLNIVVRGRGFRSCSEKSYLILSPTNLWCRVGRPGCLWASADSPGPDPDTCGSWRTAAIAPSAGTVGPRGSVWPRWRSDRRVRRSKRPALAYRSRSMGSWERRNLIDERDNDDHESLAFIVIIIILLQLLYRAFNGSPKR